MCNTHSTTSVPRPLATFRLTPAEMDALLSAWNFSLIADWHPEIRHYPIRFRAGRVEVYPPRPAALSLGKQTIRKGKHETPWLSLLRLGAQAAINNSTVAPLDDTYTRFAVTSQEPDSTGARDTYLVAIHHEVTCTCTRGAWHPGAACGHIGAVYLWLQGQRSPAPALSSAEIIARGQQAADDLFGQVVAA